MVVASDASLLVAASAGIEAFQHAAEIAAHHNIHPEFSFMCSPAICCFDRRLRLLPPSNTALWRTFPRVWLIRPTSSDFCTKKAGLRDVRLPGPTERLPRAEHG